MGSRMAVAITVGAAVVDVCEMRATVGEGGGGRGGGGGGQAHSIMVQYSICKNKKKI